MNLLEAKPLSLKNYLYLTNGTLKIPYSQRPYEWGKPQAIRLFEDFYSVHESPTLKHVLNFITVYHEAENSKFIYDGQQRTVSSLLIIAALIRILKEIGDDNSSQTFIQKYFVNQDEFDDSINTYKLIFDNRDANTIFKEYIAKGEPIIGVQMTDYNKALIQNYNLYYELLKEKLGASPSAGDIKLLLKNFLENVMLILIETTDEDIAIKMFDTLNSTGQQLADFYVLKNYLVQILSETSVKDIWENIEVNTNELSKNKFLVNYVSSFNGKTPEKNIFNRIKSLKELNNRAQAIEFLTELEKSSESFASMTFPHLRSNGLSNEKIKFTEHIKTLKILKATQYKPVIISMDLKGFNLVEINYILELIITLQVRNIYIGEVAPTSLENFYPDLAKAIYHEVISSFEEIKRSIQREMISNTILEDKFTTKLVESYSDESIIKYILREIFNYDHSSRGQNETFINDDTNVITLEHILPKTPEVSSIWSRMYTTEEREKYTYLIGNLTLLLRGANAAANNREFQIKKQEYSMSSIADNRRISENNEWDKAAIERRTQELFSKFILIWPKEFS